MSTSSSVANPFPKEKLKAVLGGFWDSKLHSPLKKPAALKTANTVFALQPELSSQQAVAVLVSCASVLGYRPSVSVIDKGGYLNKTAFIMNLLAKIETGYTEKQSLSVVTSVSAKGAQNATATI